MLRNREFKNLIISFLLITIISVIVGFTINMLSGILVTISSTSFGILFFIFTKAQYKSIAKISEQIDIVLHNTDALYICEEDEGELSILQSEIKKMTLRIKEQNKALKKEKEHLADSMADIAHQLRTPLTSVNIILSLLENNSNENERKSLIRETKELFTQMDWLLTSLLKVSRLDAGIVEFKSEQINVNSLISTALHRFQIPMELHEIVLHMNVPKNIIIRGDFNWLCEAIEIIIKNSMESVGDKGKIEISCEDTVLFTQITIHDNGKGFNKEDLPYLFNRFYRGKNSSATGYGIGLALCKMIIKRQGGSIIAKNHKEGGAIFSIRFPK